MKPDDIRVQPAGPRAFYAASTGAVPIVIAGNASNELIVDIDVAIGNNQLLHLIVLSSTLMQTEPGGLIVPLGFEWELLALNAGTGINIPIEVLMDRLVTQNAYPAVNQAQRGFRGQDIWLRRNDYLAALPVWDKFRLRTHWQLRNSDAANPHSVMVFNNVLAQLYKEQL